MKRLKLLFLGLCLAVISAQAQVVFSEDEKNFVVSQVTTPIQDAATTFTTNHDASCLNSSHLAFWTTCLSLHELELPLLPVLHRDAVISLTE